MNSFIVNLVLGACPQTRKNPNGWLSFNAPCCHHRGHNADTRRRGGIKFTSDSVVYCCFNCKFKTGYQVGGILGIKFRKLMEWLGINESDISAAKIQAIRDRGEVDTTSTRIPIKVIPHDLPEGCVMLDHTKHPLYVKYLETRGLDPNSYVYFVDENRKSTTYGRIVMPYLYENQLVGYIARSIGKKTGPKYIRKVSMPYVFGMEMQLHEYTWCPVVEGEFDAVSIGGCAIGGNEVSEEQADQLNSLQKTIVVVPDSDKSGDELLEAAIDYDWYVSFPEWPASVKDVNDAVLQYGRLFVTQHIWKTRAKGAMQIKLRQKLYRHKHTESE